MTRPRLLCRLESLLWTYLLTSCGPLSFTQRAPEGVAFWLLLAHPLLDPQEPSQGHPSNWSDDFDDYYCEAGQSACLACVRCGNDGRSAAPRLRSQCS